MKISVVTPSIRPHGLAEVQKSLEQQVFKDFEWLVEIGLPSRGNDLNKAYNRLIRRTTGEMVVSIQDYTSFKPDLLSKLWNDSELETFYTVDVGHNDGMDTEWDWRHYRKGGNIQFMEMELCCAVMPRDALIDVGGFDEELDTMTWGFDNVNLGLRIGMKDYQMKVHPTAEAIQFKHDLTEPHPWRDKMVPMAHNARLDEIRNGSVIVTMVD